MWLRDSGAQVWPYVQFANDDPELAKLIRGVILRQLKSINLDPYANVPSLLAMGYLGDVPLNDPIYQNTRRFVWSEDNPAFFRGKAGEGIGGPHVGQDMPWPMSIMMLAFTSKDDAEIKHCIEMLMSTDAGTGFIHESFHKDDARNYTRPWFAWQNTLFGELILKLIADGKADLLNSCQRHVSE